MLIGIGATAYHQQNVLARILGSAEFYAELTHSLVLDRGTGSPTFTRATTATVENNDGYQVAVLSGEARFKGARRIRNLLSNSQGASTGWTTASGGTGTASITGNYGEAPDGTSTALRVQITKGDSFGEVYQRATGLATGRILNVSVWMKSLVGTPTLRFGFFGNTYQGEVTLTTSWVRYELTAALEVGTEVGVDFILWTSHPNASATADFLCWGAQTEDVTAQTTQTAGEYVSVGVLSTPWHGAGVDGVKYFDTDISGNPIAAATDDGILIEAASTNLCLRSNTFNITWLQVYTPTITQNAVGPDGAVSAWTITDDLNTNPEAVYQSITLTAADYTLSVFVGKTVGAQASYPVILWYKPSGAAEMQGCTVDTSNGVATDWTAYTGFTMAAGRSVRISSYNNDFWRVELTKTGTAVANNIDLYPAATTDPTKSSGATEGLVQGSAVFYGAQVELGSFATEYIPTTNVAVTRNKDVHSTPTASNVVAAAGTIALTFTPTHAPSGTITLWGTYVDANNYTAILHDATNLIFRKRIAASNYDATIANAFASGTTYKVSGSWGASGVTITVDGTEGTPHANTTAAQIGSAMEIGGDGNSAQQPFAAMANCRAWQRQLSAAERAAITS